MILGQTVYCRLGKRQNYESFHFQHYFEIYTLCFEWVPFGPSPCLLQSCSFGYHAGGWGKPPVDESGKPLYGDVFGTQTTDFQVPVQEEEVDKSLWGELESESESEEESEEESEAGEEMDATGLVTPGDA